MIKILAINLNHRTRPKPILPAMIDVISELDPEIVVFTEYVDQGEATKLKVMLGAVGLEHQAVSESDEYRPGRWHNQILIASRKPIEFSAVPSSGPDVMSRTNTLMAKTYGIHISGIRVPAYEQLADWYPYWEWLNDALEGDLAIGDFNADPGRAKKKDRVIDALVAHGGWVRPDIEGEWSYRGSNGTQSRVDHVLVKDPVRVVSARYIAEPFVPVITDHAGLLVEIIS